MQIKFHDEKTSTNIPFADSDKKVINDKKVQDSIIMLGRNSVIKPSEFADIPYLFYQRECKIICV